MFLFLFIKISVTGAESPTPRPHRALPRRHGSREDEDREEGGCSRPPRRAQLAGRVRALVADAPRRLQASKQIIEAYYSRLTLDFNTNKRVAEEVAIIPTKRLRNKIAGYTTHLMKRIQRGPVRGISLKLQEEERERRMDFVPEESAINTEVIEVDRDTMDLLRSLNMGGLPGVSVQQTAGGGGGYKVPLCRTPARFASPQAPRC